MAVNNREGLTPGGLEIQSICAESFADVIRAFASGRCPLSGVERTSQHVGFTPKSGHDLSALGCPLSAITRRFAASSTATRAGTQALLTRPSTQLCQTYRDESRDPRSNDDQQSPPPIVISFPLPEPPRLNFITQPTKRCLPLQFISEAVAAERVAEFFHAAAFELSAPCGFHFRFSHPRSLIPS